jgi:hypothetical protein
MHITIIVKTRKVKEKTKQNKTREKHNCTVEANITVPGFNARLLARSQFAFGRSCDRPTRSRFSVVFLGPRANAELIPKFHFAQHASHVALQMVTLRISPSTNVGSPHQQAHNCLKMIIERRGKKWSRVRDGCLTPGRTGRLIVGRNVTLTLLLLGYRGYFYLLGPTE